MHPIYEYQQNLTRRQFFGTGVSSAVGLAALSQLLGEEKARGADADKTKLPGLSHHAAKAKHVIYLHMVGGPSQMDLFDYKPKMKDWYDKDLPNDIRNNQRLTTMTSGQTRFPIAPSMFKFAKHGKCGMDVCELLPNIAKMVDEMCFVRSMHTEAINHEPAICAMQTGSQITGKPCLGSWLSYGLGSLNKDLPAFVVMVAKPTNTEQVQAISGRLWSSGFLSGEHAGVSFRSAGDPILYINNPPGVSSDVRRKTLDGLKALNEMNFKDLADPETKTRIAQYEMAFRMQTSVPDLVDLKKEPESTFKLYGDEARKMGTFANAVVTARRLVERGVRFVQIYLNNWDTHGNAAGRLPAQCKDIDQACWGLVQDLKNKGMLDSTLIVWGGEFGRTIYSQGGLSPKNYGRDHHPRCFTMWMAGGGVKGGTIYGETDDFSYNIVKDPVHIRDLHATMLQQLGFDHEKFVYRYQGLDQRLTGVEHANVIKALLA
jgi:hypothetical protein